MMVGYILFRCLAFVIGILPWRVMYWVSDIFAWLLGSVIKYRRDVVLTNLRFAFPDKGEDKRLRIAKESYRNLCDIILESFKSFYASKATIKERFVHHTDENWQRHQSADNITAFAGHTSNWEWGIFTMPDITSQEVFGLMSPLKNKRINAFMTKARNKHGSQLISNREKKKTILADASVRKAVFFIADQHPSNKERAIPITFFGKPALAMHGGERFARKWNSPAYFIAMRRSSRGRYDVDHILLADDPSSLEYGELTQRYFNELEKLIKQYPANWLWSHKRWKHSGIYG